MKDLFKIDINRLLFYASIGVFILLAVNGIDSHNPWADEANAWNISRNLSFLEYFQITKHEGHTFLWYLVLMPFAKNDFFYPYSMLIVNFIICLGAVLLLWRYAPFNSFLKCFITFSFPFRVYVHCARCYGLTAFFLFLCCAMFKDRLKHPIIYAFLICIFANTSVMGIFGAFALGLVFLYDLITGYKNKSISKKGLTFSILVLLFTAALILFQYVGYTIPFYATKANFNYNNFLAFYTTLRYDPMNGIILPFSFSPDLRLLVITNALHAFLVIFSFLFFKEDKRPLAFTYIVTVLLIFLFLKIYGGLAWHFSFLYTYFIAAVWIYMSEYKISSLPQKIYYAFFMIFAALLCKIPGGMSEGSYVAFKNYLQKNASIYASSHMYFFPIYSYSKEVTPYLYDKGFHFYDSYGNSLESFQSYVDQWTYSGINWDRIKASKNVSGENYLVFSLNNIEAFERVQETLPKDIKLEFVACVHPAEIYRIVFNE